MKTFPLNQSQLGIFYAEQLEEGNYSLTFLYHFGKKVNLEKLCRAIEKTIAAHPHIMDRIVLNDEGIPEFAVTENKSYTQNIEKITTIDDVRPSIVLKHDLLREPLFTFRVMEGTDGGHLLFDIHHVIADGLTLGILLKDIETAYAGEELANELISIEQLNHDEIVKRQSPAYQEEKEWYNNTFGGIENESLPLKDVQDPGEHKYAITWKQLHTTKEQIKTLIAAAGVGTSIPFTAAYTMMLRAFTGDEQVAYSTFFHGRLNKNAMHSQTMMVRTMPICHDFSHLTTIQDLLTQTYDLMQNLRQKNSIGFGEVTKMCGITGAISFIYQGAISEYNLTLGEDLFVFEDLREHPAGLKLNAWVVEKEGAYWLRQEYPTDEYSAQMIAQMGETYDHILTQMLDCKANLKDITLCSDTQIAQLDRFNINEMDNTYAEWEGETIISLFRKAAAKYPDNTAAVFGDKQYTYRQLDQLTDRLAACISERAASDPAITEPVVSILIPRNEWMFLAPLAVMKAGFAYQPLDPSYPQERLNFMVKDAHASLVIADRNLRGIINEYEGPVFFTDEEIPANISNKAEVRALTPSSLLILLYTSGSTGVPKGVMLEHRNVLAYCHFYQKQCQFTPQTRTAAYASFGFDADMMDQYPTLLSGGTLYVIPEEIRLDMIALGDFFVKNKISVAFMTTQVAQQFASTYDSIGDLRILGLGGEKMMSMELPTGYTMMNIYGPTECSVAVTQKMVRQNEPNIPIGKPTETTSLYIVDKNLHRIPAGAAGELLITGPQVGRCYLNRPDKTAEAFINYMGQHCYRTGDIVRYRENGDIEFVGRKDGQVKIRGFRIELKEVEAVIREYKGISDATVQAYDYQEGGKYICAYIVSDHTINIEELNRFIMDQKPPYMVPAYTMQIERIPLNVNQKVDKKALPKPDASSSNGENKEKIAPSTPLQKKLYKMVAEVLHNEDFGVTDILSSYGLSSILSIKLAVIVYKHFGVQLDSKGFVENGTILTIEQAVKKGGLAAAKNRSVNVEEAFVGNGAPLSNAQLGVYIDCLMNEDSTMYNIPQCIVFPASVASEQIKDAILQAANAHPILSVHFEGEGEDVRQVMDTNIQADITISNSDIASAKQSFVRPFDLNHGPLWRATIVGNTLLFDIHHLIADGGSISLFVRQICDILNGENIEKENYTYFDHVRDELTADTKEEEQFFDAQLDNIAEASALPEDQQDNEEDGSLKYILQALPHDKVDAYCHTQGITPAAFYLAAMNILTSIYTASDTTQICTISNGRSDLRICDTVGMFVNTLPLVSHIGDSVVRDYVHRTADTFKATLAHEHYPFALIAEKHGTACHIMYAYQVGVLEDNVVSGEKVKIETFGLEKPKFKLQAMILDQGLELGYNDAIYSASYMEQVGQHFLAIVENMMADDNTPVASINILSNEEKLKLQNLLANTHADTHDAPATHLQSNIPMNALEEQLHTLISSIIKNEEFGVADELSYFGLTSISAIKLATQVYKTYHVKLDAKSFVKNGTLQQIENAIIEYLLHSQENATTDEHVHIDKQEEKQSYSTTTAPLANAQLGVYYDCLKNETAITYNVPHIITFPASVKADDLKSAVEQVIAAHPLLSAHFEMQNGQTFMVMNEDTTPQVVMAEGDVESVTHGYVQPFNLARGPLYRATVVGNNLLFDVHHLVMDGGSVSIFLREICEALDGTAPQKETYTYFEYAADEQRADQSAEEAFFDAQLTTIDESTALPIDLNGQEEDGHIAIVTKPIHHAQVETFCRQIGITPAAFYLAATYYIAARYSNSHDVQICTISNGRSNVQISDTIGMFVNTLPLVAHIDDITIGEFLQKTADDFTATLSHENYPFAKIAQKYGTRAELMYEYQLGVIDEMKAHGETVTLAPMNLEKPKFKVAIKIMENGGQQAVSIFYNDVLYSADYMERLADSYNAVVENLMADTKAPLRKLSIMSMAQAEEVNRLHTTATADIPVKLYHQGIEKYAAETPEHKALIAVDAEYTYAELNAEMNRVAHALIARGIGKGDAVMILLPRTSHALITMFGILKSGAAFIPCDPAYPEDRIALIQEDSAAKLVVTEPVYQELMSESQDTTNPNVDIAPTDLAYMIYTSGSTGRPKGVMLRHIGICSYLTAHPANRHIYAIKQLVSTYLSVSTISFDLSFKEYGCCFFNGITCVFAGDDEANNPLALAELMKRTHADCINGTPSRILQYMELPEFCECLKNCRVVMSGGEKYSDVLLNHLHELTKARIFNTYGPTEITVSCNVAELTQTNTISVGEPLLNYTEFVVDPDGNELPVGVVGELYVGGPGVAIGYNHLDELNATKFLNYQSSISQQPALRVFRSGDYARWQSDGQVIILGRADNQVKLRGLRIELGEVESAIARVEGIKQVLPIIRTIQGKEHLCAYFVADKKMDIDELKAEIGKTLTHYMVPTAYLQMDAFPLTPNGKTDFKHLPEALVAQNTSEYVAPQTQAERDFCEIFENILQIDKISVTDSFFEQGGSSLTATRVLIDAKAKGYDLAYADVFNYTTPRELAAKVAPDATSSESEPTDPEVTEYDYTKIDTLVQANTLEAFQKGERLVLGDVVLTGATGYLGIHILRELLENYDNTIYVLVRATRDMTAELRLKGLLFYYFENAYEDSFQNGRIVIVEGDVTDTKAFDKISEVLPQKPSDSYPLTVINCAAVVKHFSEGTEIEDVNIGGVKTCIDFCLKTGAHLIQTSTNSTGGAVVGDKGNYSEQVHYVGQILTGSKYIHSKFIAERMVLEAIIEKGLVAKVVRLGNLSARATDGEFQINYRTNSAMGRLHIFQMLGCCGYTQMASQMEFSPIDEVAHAILLLSTAPKECVIFHAFNNHMVLLGDVVDEMAKTLGVDIRFVEDNEFEAAITEAGQDPEKAKILQSMLAYRGMSKGHSFPKYNPYTIQVLARLGFRWNATSWDYVQRFIGVIASLEFFSNHR